MSTTDSGSLSSASPIMEDVTDAEESWKTCSSRVLERREYVKANNLTQFGVNAQVTFGETLVIFTIIFSCAIIVAMVYKFISHHF